MGAVAVKPAGLNDKLPQAAYAAREIRLRLQECMTAFGYSMVETPVLEYSELFLRKSGEELVNRLFIFEHRNRNLCLRPEFTSSIGRLFVEHLQHAPKPIRLQFAGPVFRYESPHRNRSRQFTMVGAELLGAGGAPADAEIIALACEGLNRAAVPDYKVVVGHIGVVDRLLQELGLDTRARRFVISHLESLRKPERGRRYVDEQLEKLYARPALTVPGLREEHAELQSHGQEQVDWPAGLKQEFGLTLNMMLRSARAAQDTSRSQEEIAERLLLKLRRADKIPRIARGIDFVERLGQIRGLPHEVLPEANDLLAAYELDPRLLKDLEDIIGLLANYKLPENNTIIDMGLGRGVHYYTGMVFEIHSPSMKSDSQLCGGGRYDDLLRVLGSNQDMPAVGLAFGLERIVAELMETREGAGEWEHRTDVVVVPVSQQEIDYAIEVAQCLRKQLHLNVELNVKTGRSLGFLLRYADRRGISHVVILGSEEKDQRTVTVRKMLAREQFTLPLDEIARTTIFAGRTDVTKPLPR